MIKINDILSKVVKDNKWEKKYNPDGSWTEKYVSFEKTQYWKVMEIRESSPYPYHVRLCNKNGKLFKEWNVLSNKNLEYYKYVGNGKDTNQEDIEKYNDSIERGVKTRRIQYLEETIAAYTKELNDLKSQK